MVRRFSTCVALSISLLALIAATAGAQRQQPPTAVLQRPLAIDRAQLSSAVLARDFEAALSQRNVPGDRVQTIMSEFGQLPEDLQLSLLQTVDQRYARAVLRDDIYIARVNPEWLREAIRRLFRISSIWPEQGCPGAWSYAFGSGFDSNCKVLFDGTEVESHYLGWGIEFFPNSMAFKVPSGATRDAMHQVVVRNTATDERTAAKSYEIVAPRGYRGYHGWKFPNFSRPSIAWHLYAHYFGAANVEYPDGTHRPAAQQWFDNAYTKAGQGGNCYGMSVSSLRVRNGEYDHMYHASYFTTAPTMQPWVWWYDWNDTTRETVQQQQGAWYTQEVLDTHTHLSNTQDARAVFTRCESLCNQVINRPVLVVWGPGWGHAIVPYETEVAGDTRRILCYDNNAPYRENEMGSVDPSVATVNWAANTFNFAGGGTGVAMSYEECTPPNPHLPGAEYGGPGSQAVVFVASEGTQVEQITDEAGRFFFNPDGSVNQDPNTRIPLSMRMFPLVQRPPIRVPRPIVVGPEPQPIVAAQGPVLYVFSEPSGKTLTFSIAGQGAKALNLFSAGHLLAVEASGAGQLQFSGFGQLPGVQIQNPSQLGPIALRYIRSQASGDRLFDVRNLRNLGTQPLLLRGSQDGRDLLLQGAPGLLFNVDVQGPIGRGAQSVRYADVLLQEGAGRFGPLNWGQLNQSALNLQLLNAQTNQLLQQLQLPPVR
ncbi:MAG: hypothetical protein AB7Y46_06240 [Armatimonadota bacterium]